MNYIHKYVCMMLLISDLRWCEKVCHVWCDSYGGEKEFRGCQFFGLFVTQGNRDIMHV